MSIVSVYEYVSVRVCEYCVCECERVCESVSVRVCVGFGW